MAAVGGTAAAMGADQTNQMGVGHNNFPPDYSRRGVRAGSGQSEYDGATDESANPHDPTVDKADNGFDGGGWGGPPLDTGLLHPSAPGPLPAAGTPSAVGSGGGSSAGGAVSSGEVAEVAAL